MTVRHISAITLAVRDMARSVRFYEDVGLEMVYGGGDATFTSFRVGDGHLNLILSPAHSADWWGRLILRVDEVDSIYERLKRKGLEPDVPRDAEWGERYFHITDPDGHELSFAEPLPRAKS